VIKIFRKETKKYNWIIYALLASLLGGISLVFLLESFINERMIDYATIEAQKICKYIVNFAVNSENINFRW